MRKKRHVHKCNVTGSASGKKESTGNKRSFANEGATRKALDDIYNKYYRNQVASLYRAIHG
ncbi:hypothetical protein ACFL5Y_02015 [Candidatus Omnitrophota bacterium]